MILADYPGAADGVRTRDLLNGNQMLYQLSHSRIYGISVADAGSVRLNLLFFRMVYESTTESGAR